MPKIILRSVDLPHPDLPLITIKPFRGKEKEISSKTVWF